MVDIRVIGVPRSGTNLTKYLVETHTEARCVFNAGWWKHAVIPALMPIPDELPTIVMFREPVAQIVSFFRFAAKGRTAICGADTLDAFVRSLITMTPPHQRQRYYFANPVEYWVQFYYAALNREGGPIHFIDLADLQAAPSIVTSLIAELLPGIRPISEPRLPARYLGRNGDAHVSESWSYEHANFAEERKVADRLVAELSEETSELIRSPVTRDIYSELMARRAGEGAVS